MLQCTALGVASIQFGRRALRSVFLAFRKAEWPSAALITGPQEPFLPTKVLAQGPDLCVNSGNLTVGAKLDAVEMQQFINSPAPLY